MIYYRRCPHLQHGGITVSPDTNSDGRNADYISSRTSAPVAAGLRVQRQITDCRGTELMCGVKTQIHTATGLQYSLWSCSTEQKGGWKGKFKEGDRQRETQQGEGSMMREIHRDYLSLYCLHEQHFNHDWRYRGSRGSNWLLKTTYGYN